MWMYLGPSYPDRFSSAELGDEKINARIRRILALGAHQNSCSSLTPLREGVISPWLSLLKLILAWLCQFLPFLTHTHACAGFWACVQRPTRGHLAQGCGE
jgi:hypothetical protein